MDEIFIRALAMPSKVYAVTVCDSNNDCNIYVNSNLNENIQQDGIQHELIHIKLNHFYNKKRVTILEGEVCTSDQMDFIKSRLP